MKYLLFLLMGLSGCSSTNVAKLVQAAGKDDATVVVKVGSVYGTGFFVRTNPKTNQTVVVSPDGTVSIGTKWMFGMRHLVSAIWENVHQLKRMSASLDALNKAVSDNTAAINAAIAAGIGGATGVPEADVQKAADAINTSTATLVAATPVTPPPTP